VVLNGKNHGTFTDLVQNYLREQNGELVPRDKTRAVPDVNYLFPAMLILESLMACTRYCLKESEASGALWEYFANARDNALRMIQDSASDDL
jgi:hypothetical protein